MLQHVVTCSQQIKHLENHITHMLHNFTPPVSVVISVKVFTIITQKFAAGTKVTKVYIMYTLLGELIMYAVCNV